MQLRPYQTVLVESARADFHKHRGVIIQIATGGGKTPTACAIIKSAVQRGRRTLFLAHRQELLMQASDKLDKFDVPHGIIKAGRPMQLWHPVQVASVQTYVRRLERMPVPDLIVIDECHLSAAKSYTDILAGYPRAYVLGLSATPERLDQRGLSRKAGGYFDTLICGPSMQELINAGYLVPMKCYGARQQIDLAGVHKLAGEFNQGQLAAAADKPVIIGDAVAHWLKLARGRPTLVFCVSIEHAEHTAAQFRGAGIKCEAVHGGWSDENRAQVIGDLRNGALEVLVSVALYVEGVDIEEVSCIINLAPTASVTRFLQKIGRGMRPAQGKQDCILLDHAGDVGSRHGFPDEEREWNIDGREKRAKGDAPKISVRICQECWAAQNSRRTSCFNCGHVFEIKAREVEHVAGELVEIQRREARREQGRAQTLDDLIKQHIARGRSPATARAWATHVLTAREKKNAAARLVSDEQQRLEAHHAE